MSTELPVTTSRRRDMTEKLLEATNNNNEKIIIYLSYQSQNRCDFFFFISKIHTKNSGHEVVEERESFNISYGYFMVMKFPNI